MMGNININISGGTVKLENLQQGSKNQISITNEWKARVAGQFYPLKEKIQDEANANDISDDNLDRILTEIHQLEDIIKNEKPDKPKIISKMEWFKENFVWTVPLIQKVIEIVLPGILK